MADTYTPEADYEVGTEVTDRETGSTGIVIEVLDTDEFIVQWITGENATEVLADDGAGTEAGQTRSTSRQLR